MPRVPLPSLLLAVLLTAGCGVDSPPSTAEQDARPAASDSPSAAAPPRTASPSPTTPAKPRRDRKQGQEGQEGQEGKDEGKIAPTEFPVARADAGRTHLLDARTLPTYDDTAGWTILRTGPEPAHPVGSCQRTPLVDIGALTAVRRAFAGPEDTRVRARQVVAKFADAKSAWRAHEVLRSWRDGCEKWLDRPNPEVGPMADVDLDKGTGGHYRAVFGEDQVRASGLGIVRKGPWLSIVDIRGDKRSVRSAWARRTVREISSTF